MNIKTIMLIALTFLSGCSAETTMSELQRLHNLESHVNGSAKLMEAESDLISASPHSFFTYQTLRQDHRSYLVRNLSQAGERKKYLIGHGFFLIDKDYVLRSSRTELVNALTEIAKNNNERLRYNND